MLLEFRTKNFKSFKDEMIFSMIPAPKQTGLDYSILKTRCGRRVYKGLCSAVFYGPNASGKSNIIGAIDVLKSIVLRGNINNSDMFTMNYAASRLELIPNFRSDKSPTEFSIKFIDDGILVDYSIKIDLGEFLDGNYPRKILEEKLRINEKLVFSRGKKLEVNIPVKTKKKQGVLAEYITRIAEKSLTDTELFLTNGYKSIYDQKLVAKILNWFDNKLLVIYRSEVIKSTRRIEEPKENTIYIEQPLTELAKEFGVSANVLGYKRNGDSENDRLELFSVLDKVNVPSEMFESYGTIRFVNEAPLVIDALINGGTLIMDEFDASIHPMALMNLITIFHNDDINRRNAQLVFNTHNPIFLDASLFRRDEIKFVERDEKSKNSIHYSLSDFRTADGVRKGEDYMKNYFVSRYGAIKDIDFSPIFERMMEESEAAHNA